MKTLKNRLPAFAYANWLIAVCGSGLFIASSLFSFLFLYINVLPFMLICLFSFSQVALIGVSCLFMFTNTYPKLALGFGIYSHLISIGLNILVLSMIETY